MRKEILEGNLFLLKIRVRIYRTLSKAFKGTTIARSIIDNKLAHVIFNTDRKSKIKVKP